MTTSTLNLLARPLFRSRLQVLAVALAFLFSTGTQLSAETRTLDFASGPGPSFSTFNSADLYTLQLNGPDFRVSKPADDGSFAPTGFVTAGIRSTFSMTGDFLVTIDFALLDFPFASPGTNSLNESLLGVLGDTDDELFLVLRFRRPGSDELEAFGSTAGPIGVQNSTLTSGRYQIERVGDTLIGRFAETGSDTFTTIGSSGGYTSAQFQIQLYGAQGVDLAGTPRSTTSLDVSFDNLIVEADGFVENSRFLNISTRMGVLTDDNVLIGGFIINGTASKSVIVRAIGPALSDFGVAGALADPTLELHLPDGSVITNNDWKDTQQTAIEASGLQPSDDRESAILQTLAPGAYTAIVRGLNNTTGIGLVEAYDLGGGADSELANISTRGFVDTGENVMIGGFIVGPDGSSNAGVLVRAIGPALTPFGVANALQDPILELHDGSGTTIAANDDWKDTQEAEITASGLQPSDDRESAILTILPPGGYTAIVRGTMDTTGVGLVEVYHLPGACVAPPVNLVGWWTGDGNGVDISGGNDATLMGGATFGAGKVSEAFSLDGVDDSVVAAQTPATDSEITLDAWIFPTSLSNAVIGPVIFEKGTTLDSRIGLQVTADGQLCGYLNSDTFNVCSAAQTIPATQFTHVAIAFSNSTQEMRLYANGALVAQTTGTDTLQTGTEQFVIGDSETSGLADNFAGLIDEVEMFDRALTVEEIQAIYNAGAFGKCKPAPQPDKR